MLPRCHVTDALPSLRRHYLNRCSADCITTSGIVAGGRRAITPALKFSPSENFVFIGKFSLKNTKSETGNPHFGLFGGFIGKKNQIWSTHNLLCRKFAAVCGKISTSCAPTFLTYDAADKNM